STVLVGTAGGTAGGREQSSRDAAAGIRSVKANAFPAKPGLAVSRTATGSSSPHVTLFNAPGLVRSFTWCLSPCLLLILPSCPLSVFQIFLPQLQPLTPCEYEHHSYTSKGGGQTSCRAAAFCLRRVLARQLGHRHQPVRATHHPAGRDQRPPFLARAHRLDRAVTLMDCDSVPSSLYASSPSTRGGHSVVYPREQGRASGEWPD
ncbi:hypothetical protein M441DRAFT_447920, partial [Trichoderma asperellum CBS 433.97]